MGARDGRSPASRPLDIRATAGAFELHHEPPWAGHLPGLVRPEMVTSLLRDFLDETLKTGEKDGPTRMGDKRAGVSGHHGAVAVRSPR